MTQKEFQDRTNITLSEEAFQALHEVYMMVPQNKDEFCGIIREMNSTGEWGLDFLCPLGYKIKAEREEAEKRTKALQAENDDMKEFIYKQAEFPTHLDMEEKAIQLLGKDEYYARCIEDGLDLPADGLKYVAELLRKEGRK